MGGLTGRRPGLLEAPRPLAPGDDCAGFDCGEAVLDDWLVRHAPRSQRAGAARIYVACAERRVVAFYALAVGSVARALALGRVRRNMPDPVPIMLLARLAVDRRWQGRGLGASLLRDADARTVQAAEIAGIRALVVHAISQDAKRFYQYFGFREVSSEPLTRMTTLGDLRASLN